MKIVLVSPYLFVSSLSTRLLSAYLKAAGHSVVQVFLQDLESMMERGVDFEGLYPDIVADRLIDLLREQGCQLVGMSLMTNYFVRMSHLTGRIRDSLDVPVVWGGVHPTIAPEECMDIADFVCVGEGEETLLELADCIEKGERPSQVANIWFRDGKGECRNPVREPISDLDSLPYPDYDLEDQYVLIGRSIRPMTEEILKELLRGRIHFNGPDHLIYETMWTRGCPHHCSYCINSYYRKLYKGCRTVRRRSADSVLDEIVQFRRRFPWINRINFMDDDFASAGDELLDEFRGKYKSQVGCQFYALLSVLSSDESKLSILEDAGLRRTQIGIQSLSPETNLLYQRRFFNREKLLDLARSIRRIFPADFRPTYDVILENPWEEFSNELETLKGVLELPRPFVLQLYTLTFYPGTVLFEKALVEGVITGRDDALLKENHDRGLSYINLLFILVNKRVPGWIIRTLAWRPLARCMSSKPVQWLFSRLNPLYRALRRNGACREQRKRWSRFVREYSGD